MPDRNPTLPLYRSLRLRKNCCILLMPFLHCHAHLWRETRGESLGGGRGEFGSEIWWWMMMRWITFYIIYTKAFWDLGDNTVLNFCFYFLTLLAPCMLLLWKRMSLETLRQNFALAERKLKARKMELKKWMIKNNKRKNKKIKKIIREILRERTIEQLQLIRG